MRVFVPTCDHMLWCLRPFAYLFNLYWSEMQDVVIGCYTMPTFPLPPNFRLHQIDTRNYPAEKWSDGMLRFLGSMPDEVFVLMLEDYFLRRTVDWEAVASLVNMAYDNPSILRIDLTDDRQYAGGVRDLGGYGRLDMVETGVDVPYQLSLQACVVRRENFMKCLRPGLTPAQFELQDQRVIPDGLRVLGTRQSPVRYANGVGTGHGVLYLGGIPEEHVHAMYTAGMFPPDRWENRWGR